MLQFLQSFLSTSQEENISSYPFNAIITYRIRKFLMNANQIQLFKVNLNP